MPDVEDKTITPDAKIRGRSYLLPLILSVSLSFISIGCGGGSYSPPPPPQASSGPPSPGPSAVLRMNGPWEILFQSSVSANEFTVLEANLSQTDTHVVGGTGGAHVLQGQGTTPYLLAIELSRLSGKCDSGAGDEVTFDGTLTNPQPVAQTMTFTLTENGDLGSAVITASASFDSNGSLTGTYTLPAACGFPEDQGTLLAYQDSYTFSANDAYSGSIQGNPVVMRFASASSGFGLSATGTYGGAPVALSGSTTGLFFNLTGTVSGQAVTWFGLYDSLYNTFRIYDSDANLLGGLDQTP